MKRAEDTVKEILIIYALADAYEGAGLTKKEIKNHKKYYKDLEAMYAQYAVYGLSLTYTLNDYLNAKQFDSVMEYFTEIKTANEDQKVEYVHIGYKFKETTPVTE